MHRLQTGGDKKVNFPKSSDSQEVFVNLLGQNSSRMGMTVAATQPICIGKNVNVRIQQFLGKKVMKK